MAKKRPEELEEKILDVSASMQGTIAFKDPVNLRINGSFEGKLDTRGSLTIGENANVKANITGDRILIAGKVQGDVTAAEKLSIVAPAMVRGTVQTPVLSVGEGAILDGPCRMIDLSPEGDRDRVLSLSETAQYLELESAVVEEWAAKRKIPAFQEGSSWRFRKQEIDVWIQSQNQNPSQKR